MMNNKILIVIAVISLLLNIIVVSMLMNKVVNADITSVIIPTLPKDSSYVIKIPKESYSCVEMENKLGLKRGDIVSITKNTTDGVIITFGKGVALDNVKVQSAIDTVKGMMPSITTK